MKKIVVLIALGVCCVLQAGLIAYLLLSPSLRYKRTQTELSLSRVLCYQVHSGDTLARVTELLGPGVPASREHYDRRASHHSKFPEFYPVGIQDTDTLLLYPCREWTTIWLQFRDGKLVNHTPEVYRRNIERLDR